MLMLLAYLIVGFGAIGALLLGAFTLTLNKMVTDEMRARLDDIPAVLVALALRLAPADRRDSLRADWVDNLLVAFDEKNARYPVSRILRSLPFVLPLLGTAAGLRSQARAIRRRAKHDEKLERLPEPQVIRPAPAVISLIGIPSEEAIGQPVAITHNPDGSVITPSQINGDLRDVAALRAQFLKRVDPRD